MMRARSRSLLVVILVGLTCIAAPAAAEWNVDIYGGAAWVESADVRVRGTDSLGKEVHLTIFDIDSHTGFTVGLRNGYWLDSLPFLGFDLDLFYLQVPVPAQTRAGTGSFTGEFLGKPISVSVSGSAAIPNAFLPILGFAPEIRLRWPLFVDGAFPAGRLQPYISGGPAWAFSVKDNKLAVELGGKLGGGLAYNVTSFLALFSEYRYAFFPDFRFTDNKLSYSADVNSHSVVAGVSFRF